MNKKFLHILFGKGCLLCSNKYINQNIVNKKLLDLNIVFEQEVLIKNINKNEIKNYRVDFYIPTKNIIIEYNGLQHYQPVNFTLKLDSDSVLISHNKFKQQQERDEYIREFCLNNKIKLIEIDGRKYKYQKLKKLIDNLYKDLI